MSRTIHVHCNRCGATCLDGGHSILEVKAGELANRVEEPYLDLCAGCVDRFLDWLREGRQNALTGVGAGTAELVRELDTVTR